MTRTLAEYLADVGEDSIDSAGIVVAAGISYRQLDHWTRHGWLTPAGDGTGSGFRRTYDLSQVAIATVMGELGRLLGIRASVAYPIARALVDHGDYTIGNYTLRRDLP